MSESKYQKTERLFAALVKLAPDEQGRIIAAEYSDDPEEMERLGNLLATEWEHRLPSLADHGHEQPSPLLHEHARTETAAPAEPVLSAGQGVRGPGPGGEKPRYLGKY